MLEKFGLTKTEEKVYLALTQLGSSFVSEIIKKTQLHRTTVYDVLDRLLEKGFVSFIIKNKLKEYSTTSPSKLLDIALEEEEEAKEKHKLAQEVIKKIQSLKKESKSTSPAQIFVGLQGQKNIMKDIVDTGKNFYVFGSQGKFEENLSLYTEQWARQRREKNITARIIATEGTESPIWKLNQIKFLPKEYQSPAATIIYGSKVAIFIHEEPILIVLIESEKLVKSYLNYFNLLWGIAR
ncbi:MAG: helix-turn-helix domain-containing protein [Nanoarchaeota archaeon]|nr:helix-turn-helix domain-containing protein [Nanoarchaeota archaeon]